MAYPGPIYIRLGKGYDLVVSRSELPFKIGKAITMQEGQDALLITTGVGLQVTLDAAEQLARKGIEATVLHMHTVKPLDVEAVLQYAGAAPVIVTVEEHSVIGGLGSAVAELLAESDFEAVKRFRRIGIPDTFAEEYGSQNSLMASYGITAENVVEQVTRLVELTETSQVAD